MSWTERFFGDYYLKIHLPLLTDEINEKEVEFVEDVLNLIPGQEILDLPCGHGRHSNILAKKGYKVTGIDNNPEFISFAKQNSEDIKVEYFLQDMREVNFDNRFDAVLNLFTSFGFFSDEENLEVLSRMSKSLIKGGRLILETVNRDWALKQTKENGLVWLLYPDNKVFLANNKFNIFNGRWFSDQIIVENGKSFQQHQDIRLYTYTEINSMFERAGMEITKVFGDNSKTPYSINSRNMIIVAKKI